MTAVVYALGIRDRILLFLITQCPHCANVLIYERLHFPTFHCARENINISSIVFEVELGIRLIVLPFLVFCFSIKH